MIAAFLRLAVFVAALAASAACTPGASPPPRTSAPQQVAAAASIEEERHEAMLRALGGVYPDARVQAYVSEIGFRLLDSNGIDRRGWRFTLLDTPMVGAWASAPRDIYVTRGLLVLMDDESQVANVIGHEIAHNALNHSAQRVALVRNLMRDIGRALQADDIARARALVEAAPATISRFGREHEIEADRQGMIYARAAGYRAVASTEALARMDAHSRLRAAMSGLPDPDERYRHAAASHPAPSERVRLLREIGAEGPGAGADRDRHLAAIDGLLAEEDPYKGGVVRGRRWVHLSRGVIFEAPDDFALSTQGDQAAGEAKDGSFLFVACGRPQLDGTLVRALERIGQTFNLADVQPRRVNGLDAAAGVGRVRAHDGAVEIRMSIVRLADGACLFVGFASPKARPGRIDSLEAAGRTFRMLGSAEIARLGPKRIAVLEAKPGDSVASLAARMAYPDYKVERFRTINGLAEGDSLAPGRKVKLVVD